MNLPKPYFEDDAVTIYNGDAREIAPSVAADVVITDPPYGIDYASNQIGALQGVRLAGDDDASLWWWAVDKFGEMPAVIFGSWRMPPPTARSAVIWDKGDGVGMGDLTLPWRPNFEVAYIFGDGWAGHRGSGVIRDVMVSWVSKGRMHPTQKPVPLIRQFIAKAPPGIVLDPFAGSGTTGRAAKDLGRKAILIEIEERYCEIAAKRMAQAVLI